MLNKNILRKTISSIIITVKTLFLVVIFFVIPLFLVMHLHYSYQKENLPVSSTVIWNMIPVTIINTITDTARPQRVFNTEYQKYGSDIKEMGITYIPFTNFIQSIKEDYSYQVSLVFQNNTSKEEVVQLSTWH